MREARSPVRSLDADETGKEARERDLRTSEARLQQVVEAAPTAMVMIDAGGRIEMVNAQAERLFGYARAELLGQSIEILVPERLRGHHPRMRQSFFADPRSRPMGAGRELHGLRRDGSEFPVEIGLNPIETDEGTMVVSAIVDISERKRLEERFRRAVESAPNAMVMANGAGRIEMVNAQAERMFGYSRAELLGQPVDILVPERLRGHHPRLRELFLTDPHVRPMGAGRDLNALRKDGSEFPVEIGLNPIETDEGMMVLSSIVDISERKQREERIMIALKEKELLLGEIHHRVKNNLQIVNSLMELQFSRISDPALQTMLTESQNRVRTMALIHQTLYQSGNFAEVDFGRFLDALVPTLISSYGIDPERVTLEVDSRDVLLPISAAIPCGVLVNELISNALKHAFPKLRRGWIKVSLEHVGEAQVRLAVVDNGIGIPTDLDVENTTTLGLQLVTLLAEQLGAQMVVRRADPTSFELHFPLAK